MRALLLAVLLSGTAAHAQKSVKMTPELKAKFDAISVEERAALQPLQDQERDLRKQRATLAQAKVKAYPAVKSKEDAASLSKEISSDPAIQDLERQVKDVRKQMKDKRVEFRKRRREATVAPVP